MITKKDIDTGEVEPIEPNEEPLPVENPKKKLNSEIKKKRYSRHLSSRQGLGPMGIKRGKHGTTEKN